MSLDISLLKKPEGEIKEGQQLEEIASMNWLRNPFGLCNWAEDNFKAVGAKTDTELWYVINHWNYKDSPNVDKKLFKSVVDSYWKVLQKIDKGYFFFDVYCYIQFIEPHRDKFPDEFIAAMDSKKIAGLNHKLESKIGIPMEHFIPEIIDLGGMDLEKYKNWFFELVKFAEKLQDEDVIFYCSN